MSRSRNFCFTQNNYPDTSLVDNVQCRYLAYSREIGASGTPHLQGYVSFANGKTLRAVIGLMPGCHIEVMQGSLVQNETYCSKSSDLVERGEKPLSKEQIGATEKERWENARVNAKAGKLDEIDADIYLRLYSTLKIIRNDHVVKPPPTDVKCYWIYGPTGTGKSHCVETAYPDCYKKSMDDMKWFDGYTDQAVVYLEDIDKYQVRWGGMLKRLADRWPMQASIKGSMKYIRPTMIIVTSNVHLNEIWSDSATLDPLLRRFEVIYKENQEQEIDFTQNK